MSTIIPRSISGFNTYIRKTTAYLITGTPTNWSRFNWDATEIADWEGFLTDWIPLYTAYCDKKGQYTTGIKDQLHSIIAACVALCKSNHLLKSIEATRKVSVTDLQTFNLPIEDVTGEAPHQTAARTAAATELVYPLLKTIGGGIVRCKCFTEVKASGRPKKLDGFDLIQFVYKVVAQATTDIPAAIPTDPADTTLIYGHSTKANFLVPTGTKNTGKLLCIFFRWTNSKHPELDGPWSNCFITTIL
jgi:hypothetical protein